MKISIKHPVSTAFVLLGALTIVAGSVSAGERRDQLKQKIQSMSYDEKKQAVDKGFSQWDSLTQEQRDAAIAQAQGTFAQANAKVHEAWGQMTPEEQQAALAEAKTRSQATVQKGRAKWQGKSVEDQQQMKSDAQSLREQRRAVRQGHSE